MDFRHLNGAGTLATLSKMDMQFCPKTLCNFFQKGLAKNNVEFNLKLTKKNTKETKELFKDKNHYKYISHTTPLDYLPPKSRKAEPLVFYTIRFRVVRFPISSNAYETVITNLDSNDYPPSEIKKLYAARWEIVLISA